MSQIFKDDLAAHAARSFFWNVVSKEINRDFFEKKPLTVLDYGCSYGGFIQHISEVLSISQCFGTDIDNDCVSYCESTFKEAGYIFFPVNDLSRLVNDSTIDVVCAIEVIAYVDDIDLLFNLLYRKMKPGGVFYALLGMHSNNSQINKFKKYIKETGNNLIVRSIDAYIDSAINHGFFAYAKRLELSEEFGVRLSGQNKDLGISYFDFINYMYRDKLMIKLVRSG